MRILFISLLTIIITSCSPDIKNKEGRPLPENNLKFPGLSKTWDEAIPLGNGMLGALIWEKDGKLRFSLDRADLWDLRPMENLGKPEWKFSWVKEQWEKNTYSNVQEMFDVPYDREPAPSKIPGAALEFDISSFGDVESVELNLKDALCTVKWKNGVSLETFVNAENLSGWYRFKGLNTGQNPGLTPGLLPPSYNLEGESGAESPVTGQDLRRLGYPKGEIIQKDNSITYNQEGWGGFKYQVNVRWKKDKSSVEGCWSISSEYPGWEKQIKAEVVTDQASGERFESNLKKHRIWWKNFWLQSDISVPDTLLQKQWYLEMYKLGSATGNGAPPISLQAVWTADNGKLPPWKGDFHHDLNTQLSYWPAYSSNHMEQEKGFSDWLQKNRGEFEKYTKEYYGVSGLNVPGVTTLTGQPMGGWIQYSFGPTVSAWLGHHFYLRWRYTMDREFLENEAYPWIRDVADFFDKLSVRDSSGLRKLPLSSSPEIFDNSRKAWFAGMTNFDLGMVRWTYEKAAELAEELGKKEETARWREILNEWPQYDTDPETGFTFIKGVPYKESHRHFSHLVAFHPLGIVDWSNGEKDQHIIKSTLANLDKIGPDWWCGYSYSWLGNLKARAFDGKGASEALRIFAADFCLKNSFHVNGDQSGTGKSKFTYRPFTLEGNFAFASGLQEMLIQSHTGIVHIFPAIPGEWEDVSFDKLRTEGAFLVSSEMKAGQVVNVTVSSEKGGEFRILNPFKNPDFKCSVPYDIKDNILIIRTEAGQTTSIHI
jgi:alpha-L-fucosidase 2